MGRNIGVRRDDLSGVTQGLGLEGDKPRVSAKIAERRAFRMQRGRTVEPCLDLGHRQCGHQYVEGASAEVAAFPQEREQVLMDDDIQNIVTEPASVTVCEFLVRPQQVLLAGSTLGGQLSGTVRPFRRGEKTLVNGAEFTSRPRVIGLPNRRPSSGIIN